MCVKIKSKIAAGHNIIKFNVAKARTDESICSILPVFTLPLRGSLSLSVCGIFLECLYVSVKSLFLFLL